MDTSKAYDRESDLRQRSGLLWSEIGSRTEPQTERFPLVDGCESTFYTAPCHEVSLACANSGLSLTFFLTHAGRTCEEFWKWMDVFQARRWESQLDIVHQRFGILLIGLKWERQPPWDFDIWKSICLGWGWVGGHTFPGKRQEPKLKSG